VSRTIKYIVIGFLALVATGALIVYLFRKKIASRYIPEVSQVGIVRVALKNDTSYLNFNLALANKTFLKIEVDTITYTIALFNKTYLEHQRFIGLILPGSGKDTLLIDIKIPYVDILKNLNSERKKGDSTSYSIQLYLQYKTIFGRSEIAINKDAKLKIPRVPELEVINIEWNRVRFKSIMADVSIKLTNYSDITLTIKDLNYSIDVFNEGKLTGIYKDPIVIKPKGVTLANFPIELAPNRIVKTIFDVITNRDIYPYTLTLNATLKSNDLPKEDSIQIELVKNGQMELRK
jgi:LEA14-like dessication related protein